VWLLPLCHAVRCVAVCCVAGRSVDGVAPFRAGAGGGLEGYDCLVVERDVGRDDADADRTRGRCAVRRVDVRRKAFGERRGRWHSNHLEPENGQTPIYTQKSYDPMQHRPTDRLMHADRCAHCSVMYLMNGMIG
jgi:hypothetical protein